MPLSQTTIPGLSWRGADHTGAEVLSALQGQAQRWLMPRKLKPGMVVSDHGTNLISALRQGQLTHVPCFAHVLNLVVQRFLGRYPGLQDVLKQARKLCAFPMVI